MALRLTNDNPYFRDVRVVPPGESLDSPALGSASMSIRILRDQQGHNVAKRLFENYIRGESGHYSRFAEFLVSLDKLLSEFGGQPLPIEGDSDDTEGSESESDDDIDLDISDEDEDSSDEYASGDRNAAVLLGVLLKSR